MSGANGNGGHTSPLAIAKRALDRGRAAGSRPRGLLRGGPHGVHQGVWRRGGVHLGGASRCGLGVRAIRDGRVGYAFTADLSDSGLDAVLAGAVANVDVTDADPYAGLPRRRAAGLSVHSRALAAGVGRLSLEDKVALALAVERRALACPGVETVEESAYSDEESRIAICSSTGVEAEAEHSFCFVYAQAHAGHDEDRQSGLGFNAGRDPEELDAEAAGHEAGEKAAALLGARPCDTGSLHRGLRAGRSWLRCCRTWPRASAPTRCRKAGRCSRTSWGRRSAPACVTLARRRPGPGGHGHQPVRRRGRAPAADSADPGGALEAYLHSSYTARKAGEGAASTGNAERGSYRTASAGGGEQPGAHGGVGHAGGAGRAGRQRPVRGERCWSALRGQRDQRRDLGGRHRQADRERRPRRGRCARSPSPRISFRFLGRSSTWEAIPAGSHSTAACARRRWRWSG